MNIYYLDFETFYSKEFSLSKMSTEAYVRDPQFETIGFAIKENEGETQWFSGTHKYLKQILDSYELDKHAVCCHNSRFDIAILNWLFDINPARILDTLSMANVMVGINESVSLANLSKLYAVGVKGTEVLNALGKRLSDFTESELVSYGNYCINDVELTAELFTRMLAGELPHGAHMGHKFPKKELAMIDLTMRMFIEPVLVLDNKILQDNLWDVQLNKRNLMHQLMNTTGAKSEDELKQTLMSNDKFALLLKEYGVIPPLKISPATGKETWAFAKTDQAFLELENHPDLTVQAIFAARMGHKSTIEETRTTKMLAAAGRGVYPVAISYSGAHISHRFSGIDGSNIQNLGRNSKLRNAIKAPAGYKLVIGDLSNIELRMGMWLARQDDVVEKIRNGLDVYSDFGSVVFNRTYEDIRAEHKAGWSQDRFCSKEACLAGIFGTGGAKLMSTLNLKGKLSLDVETATTYINTFRSTYYKVVEAWSDAKQVLNALMMGMPMTYLRDGVIKVTKSGLVKPNGLILPYPDLRREYVDGKPQITYQGRKGNTKIREKVYAAKMYQNCVQSLSRDLMVEAMLRYNKEYKVVCTVHDEMWTVVPEAEALTAARRMQEVLSTAPSWCASLPLASEVYVGDSYGTVEQV